MLYEVITHVPQYRDTCIKCHMGRSVDLLESNHTFETKPAYCRPCHPGAINNPSDPAHPFRDIRYPSQFVV